MFNLLGHPGVPLYVINKVHCYSYAELIFHPWDKSLLVVVYDFFYVSGVLFSFIPSIFFSLLISFLQLISMLKFFSIVTENQINLLHGSYVPKPLPHLFSSIFIQVLERVVLLLV